MWPRGGSVWIQEVKEEKEIEGGLEKEVRRSNVSPRGMSNLLHFSDPDLGLEIARQPECGTRGINYDNSWMRFPSRLLSSMYHAIFCQQFAL